MKLLTTGVIFTTLISIVIHALIIYSVSTIKKPNIIKPKKEVIEFNVVYDKTRIGKKKSKAVQPLKSTAHKASNKNNKSRGLKKLSALLPSNQVSQLATQNNYTQKTSMYKSGGYTKSGSYQKFSKTGGAFGVMNSMNATDYSQNIWFYEVLWNKLNFNSTYPEDIAKQRITGNLNVHALINKKGQLIELLEVSGPENLLKAYVIVNLIHTLKKPMDKKSWLKGREQIPILITYEFILHELAGNQYHNPDTSDQGNHLKNTFVIKKHRIIDNRITQYYAENIAPFIPPILPIPGGFIIDFIAAYKMIDTWGEPTASVRRKRRLKDLKKVLNQTIKKQETKAKQSTKLLGDLYLSYLYY